MRPANQHVLDVAAEDGAKLGAHQPVKDRRLVAVLQPEGLVVHEPQGEVVEHRRALAQLLKDGLANALQDQRDAGDDGRLEERQVARLALDDARAEVGHGEGRAVADLDAGAEDGVLGDELEDVGQREEAVPAVVVVRFHHLLGDDGEDGLDGVHKVGVGEDDA